MLKRTTFTVCINAPVDAVSPFLTDILYDEIVDLHIVDEWAYAKKIFTAQEEKEHILLIRVFMPQENDCQYFELHGQHNCTEVDIIFPATSDALVRNARVLLAISSWLNSFDAVDNTLEDVE